MKSLFWHLAIVFLKLNIMLIHVTKRGTRKKLDTELSKLPSKKRGINLKKYFGKVNFGVDGLSYQKEIRKND